MNFGGIELCCPVCRADVAQAGQELVCRDCSRRFPVIAGIPDLRVFPDPYIGMEDDRKKGVGLAELWPSLFAMAALAAIMLTLSVLRFRKSLD